MKTIKNYETISTKKGDKGTSINYSNEQFNKTDILFDTLGTFDELTSFLGLAYHYAPYKDAIQMIQKDIQSINSIIATNPKDHERRAIRVFDESDVKRLEDIERDVLKKTEIAPRFVLPGSDSTKPGAYLDVCRALSRKAERMLNRFYELKERTIDGQVLAYVNRLSDLLFIMARSMD
jgi:cob(I)alamin adenosyltransferase